MVGIKTISILAKHQFWLFFIFRVAKTARFSPTMRQTIDSVHHQFYGVPVINDVY